MANLLIYAAVVLIWGNTWYAIKFQLGVVSAEASLVYRFALAAALMFAWAFFRQLPLRFSLRDHLFLALQGALIFSNNFYLMYLAAEYITTGLLAVVFSMASAFTMLLNGVIFRRAPVSRAVAGAVMGVVGVGCIFKPELTSIDMTEGAGLGLVLAIVATLSFSFGSLLSARNQQKGLSVRGGTAWGMFYGSALLVFYVVIGGKGFAFETTFTYVASLLYLSVFGSVVAFACYFALLARIGTDRAAYATVLFPIVALGVSTLFEGYVWTLLAFVGVVLTMVGNVLILWRTDQSQLPVSPPTR